MNALPLTPLIQVSSSSGDQSARGGFRGTPAPPKNRRGCSFEAATALPGQIVNEVTLFKRPAVYATIPKRSEEAMPDPVTQACEACFDEHKSDCSGFARAVAEQVGVTLTGLADQIVDTIRGGGDWRPLADGVAAAASAHNGKLVIAGLKGSEQTNPDPHGHVVVVVDGPLARGTYPSAYWGKLGGVGAKDQTINFAWNAGDRDRVSYAEHDIGP
jgi:hypothetical protein